MIESSFGVIPARKIEGQWQLLMVKHRAGHWSFPKGHSESSESPLQTAKRELFEETGLSITRQLYTQPIYESYHFQKEGETIDKTVSYFIAEVSGDLRLQTEELSDFAWVPLQDAEKQATFSEAQNLCRKLMQVIL